MLNLLKINDLNKDQAPVWVFICKVFRHIELKMAENAVSITDTTL